MPRTLCRVHVLSMMKLGFALGLILGLILDLFLAFFAILGASAGGAGSLAEAFGLSSLLLIPVMYAFGLAAQGALVAVVYNVSAAIVGGITVDIE